MIIRTVPVTPFEQNCRILLDEASGSAAVVDPGGEVSAILSALTLSGAPVVSAIILTHSHIDHAGGVAQLLREVKERQDSPPVVVGNERERAMRAAIGRQALMFGLSPAEYEDCPEPGRLLDEGDTFLFGSWEFRVLSTPGHSPGHLSFFQAKSPVTLEEVARGGARVRGTENFDAPVLLAGDALFAGSIGRTDLPGGNHAQLIASIREKLLPLPADTLVLSGHGPMTTIERERRSNPFLR